MKIQFDASKIEKRIQENTEYGNDRIRVTNQCLYRDNKPWLPIMGEFQYSRYPEKDWRKSLRLMKEAGVEIVASYVFWNHHEEEKGNFRFDGNLNIRKFVGMCIEEGMEFFLRVGPWVHGEARNGGFPDWLLRECYEACKDQTDVNWPWTGIGTRMVAEPFMTYTRQYLHTIYNELRDVKEHIIGIQLDNEVHDCVEYLRELKKITEEEDMRAPLMTATAWGAKLAGTGLLPIWGGYPDDPWSRDRTKIDVSESYDFSLGQKSDVWNLIETGEASQDDLTSSLAPSMTCELGTGLQVTYHNRPKIEPEDIYALTLCYLGSGTNLLGYYVFHGGYNPMGKYSTMQEHTDGYADYPIISYDFQAAIGDVGQVRKQYFLLQEIFRFCHHFGDALALMPIAGVENKPINCAFRSDGEKGFLFVNQHCRHRVSEDVEDVCFDLKLERESITVPFEKMPAEACFYMPIGFTFGTLRTNYVKAKPAEMGEGFVRFIKITGIKPEMQLKTGETILLEDGIELNGMKIFVEEVADYKASVGRSLSVVESKEKSCDFDLCIRHLGLEDLSTEYRVRFSEDAKYLQIKFMGNLAAVYHDGKLICDQYFYGKPWTIKVADFEKKEIILRVQPFTEQDLQTLDLSCEMAAGKFKPEVAEFFEETIYE